MLSLKAFFGTDPFTKLDADPPQGTSLQSDDFDQCQERHLHSLSLESQHFMAGADGFTLLNMFTKLDGAVEVDEVLQTLACPMYT